MVFKVFMVFVGMAGGSLSLLSAEQKDVKLFFQRTCAACHGLDGSGRGLNGQKLPGRVLSDARWQGSKKDADLVKSILKGKCGMPSFQSQLSETDRKSTRLNSSHSDRSRMPSSA